MVLSAINNAVKDMSIKYKLIFVFSVFIVLPLLLGILIIYNKSADLLIEKEHQTAIQTLSLVRSNIETRLSEYEQKSLQFYKSGSIFQTSELMDVQDRRLTDFELISMKSVLQTLITGEDYIESVYLFLKNGQVAFSDASTPGSFQDIYEANPSWKEDIEKLNGKCFWIPSFNMTVDSRNEATLLCFSYARLVKSTYGNLKPMGNMVVNINTNLIKSICSSVQISKNGMILITDNKGSIIWHENSKMISQNLNKYSFFNKLKEKNEEIFETAIDGSSYLVVGSNSRYNQWRYIALIPINDIHNQIVPIRTYFILIVLICLFINIAGAFVVQKYVTSPIQKIIVAMDHIKTGKMDNSLEAETRDEIGVLYTSFNSMNNEIKNLILEINESISKEKEFEIKALRAQINPHFLYNTLDTINWMIRDEKYKNASDMILSLSKIFRYSISKLSEYVTLDEELQWAGNYIYIQKNRFEDKFDVEFDIDSGVLKRKTLRLILQPFIENAILHGLNDIDAGGKIIIKAYQKGDIGIFVEISDNGRGMTPEELCIVKGGLGKGIGIYNINQHIKLKFGGSYGVEINSEPGKGTIAVIFFPVID